MPLLDFGLLSTHFQFLLVGRAPNGRAMSNINNLFNTLADFDLGHGKKGHFQSLPALEKAGLGPISRLPVSIRLVLESVLRNCDGKKVTEQNVRDLANWQPKAARTEEIPFVVARIVLQDFTGVPLLVDLAAMRSAVARLGKNPQDRSSRWCRWIWWWITRCRWISRETTNAYRKNLEMEFKRNRERYQFLKWGMQAFDTFKVVPPGIGIIHQVNLEYLAKGVQSARRHSTTPTRWWGRIRTRP